MNLLRIHRLLISMFFVMSGAMLAWGIHTKTWGVVVMAALALPGSALYLRKLFKDPPIPPG